MNNLFAVSTDKKSACDSKLIVDHSSQKTQQHKDFAVGAAGGLVVQLQRGYNSNSAGNNGRPDSPVGNQHQQQQQQAVAAQERESSLSPQRPAVMEEPVEQ